MPRSTASLGETSNYERFHSEVAVSKRVSMWLGLLGGLLLSCCKTGANAGAPEPSVSSRVDTNSAPAAGPSIAPGRSAGSVDCENASFEFRRLVSSCFPDHSLCGEVLAVDYDGAGIARSARFATSLSDERALTARNVLACVNDKLSALNRCAELKTRSFRQSCTLP
jgi:hypothetical protein